MKKNKIPKKFWKILDIAKIIAFIIVIILACLSLLTILPLRTPIKPFIVLSGSMSPTIYEGSIIFVQRGFDKVKVGDVVAFKRPDKPIENVTHRIVKEENIKGKNFFITKGDANNSIDLWNLPKEAIWGKTLFSVPLLGYIISFSKTKIGVILTIFLPLIIIAFDEVRVIYLEIKRMKKKKEASKEIKDNLIIKLIILIAGILSVNSQNTQALFNDSVQITNNKILTGYWTSLDTTAPVTTLLTTGGRIVNERVTNGGFEFGLTGWSKTGKVNVVAGADGIYASPYGGSSRMVKIGHDIGSGNNIWENKLSQQLQNGAKNVSFYYNFYSFDTAGSDSPSMLVKINDYEVWRITADEINTGDSPNKTGWRQVSFDLSGISDPVLEIIFYSGNTEDELLQSWLYIDNVSTAEAVVSDSTTFTLTSIDAGSGVASTYYSFNGLTWNTGTTFTGADLPEDINTVYFYSVDNAGNPETISSRRVLKNNIAPNAVSDLDADTFSKNTIILSWTAPGDNGGTDQASIYDIRYSTTCPIVLDADFNNATPVSNEPAPKKPGQPELFEVSGLDAETTYCFALKTGDSVPNWSTISNSPQATTPSIIVDSPINPGEVVINELMWPGSSANADDEWIELRNMTSESIDLSGWQITSLVGVSNTETLMLTIPSGKFIPANGYFLISKSNKYNSKINRDPDLVASVVLRNNNLQIKLYKGAWTTSANLIDTAGNGNNEPEAGELTNYYSMERNDIPGDGTQASNWHTCLADASLLTSYWDEGFVEKGTPGGANLSQISSSPLPLAIIVEFVKALDDKSVSFKVENITDWESLTYEITYNSDEGPQGILSTLTINKQNIIQRDNLKLGTCSSLGEVCIYNNGVKDLKLRLILKKESEEKILEKTL